MQSVLGNSIGIPGPPMNEFTAILGTAAVPVTRVFAPEDCTINKCKWLLCVLMALTLTAGSALAQDADKPKKNKPARAKKTRPQKAKNVLRGEYGIMASELKLTDEQKAKFVETIQSQREAGKPKDEAKCKELEAKLKALRSDPKADKAALMAILTDAQKDEWNSFKIYKNVCGKFGKAKLTQDQKQTIRDMCNKVDIKTTGDKKANAAVLKGLSDNISANVLTDAQRQAMAPKPKVKKVKKDKPAGAK